MGTNTSAVLAVARSQSMCGTRQSVGSCGLETSLISVGVMPVVASTASHVLLFGEHAHAIFRELALQAAIGGIQQRHQQRVGEDGRRPCR